MAYVITESTVGWQPIAETSDVQNHPFGTIVRAVDPTYGAGEFIYLQGVAGTAVGSAVTYQMDDGTTVVTVANAIGPVAIAMSANTANRFGWYQIQGKAVARVATGFVDNAVVYLTATAGVLDDAVVAGDRVKGARGASAIGTPAAGLAEMEIARPYVDDIADA
jgi:hypothetical protein